MFFSAAIGTFVGRITGDGATDARRGWLPNVDDLLRVRQRALADKRPGAAEAARDEMRAAGVSVRDRHNTQQYRMSEPHKSTSHPVGGDC